MTGAYHTLMAHQEEGVRFLVSQRAGLLAFEQGLGKTLVAIEAFRTVRAQGLLDCMLVVCPNSLKRNWRSEIDRFASGLDVQIVEGSPTVRRRALASASASVVILSYETARAEMSGVLALIKRRRTALVLDESHAVKNRRSLTSTAAQQFAPHCQYRWLLSGTPVTNSIGDLYAQMKIVGGNSILGTFESFLATYGEPSDGAEILRRRLALSIFRRTKLECLDLPDKTFVDVRVELPPWQRKLYDDMRDELVCTVQQMSGEDFRAFAMSALAQLMRLSQLASNPALILPTEPRTPGKFMELDALVNEIVREGGEKLIIWSHYVGTLRALSTRFADLRPVTLYGDTPIEDRQSIAAQFQSDPDVRLLIANPAAAGTGYTFTSACYAIYETFSWRYDFYAQSQDRIHRIGQRRPVTYLRLIAADTIEEAIIDALERKSKLAAALLGDKAGPTLFTNMSPGEFCTLLTTNKLQ